VVELTSIGRGRRNTLPVLAAISIILMMGTLPIVRADYSINSNTYVFYGTSCNDLGAHIEARFGWDITNGNNTSAPMTIKEKGNDSIYSINTGDGAFKFDENPIGMKYTASDNTPQWPSIQGFADFRHYGLYQIDLLAAEPDISPTSKTEPFNMTAPESDSLVNFSTSADAFHITIVQTSSVIEILYSIIDSSGTALGGSPWALVVQLSGASNPPPYAHYAVSDGIAGLEKAGYAHILSGTDFQIEAVDRPSSPTDFTAHQGVTFTGNNGNNLPNTICSLNSFVDEEGDDATYTYGSNNVMPGSNEAYQYVKVT
jgi:hypothetical protein